MQCSFHNSGRYLKIEAHKFLFPIFMPWSYISAFSFHSKYQSPKTFLGGHKASIASVCFSMILWELFEGEGNKKSNRKLVLCRPVF